ncbi:hypothetical protein D9M71_803520 [compost metagenome]
MAFVQGELVHHQLTHLAWLKRPHRGFQAALVECLEGVPVQAGEAADMADRQQLQQTFEPDAQTLGQAGGRLQPVNSLGHPPTIQAIDAAHRQLEQHTLIEQVTIPHLTNSPLVDQRAGLGTPAANR